MSASHGKGYYGQNANLTLGLEIIETDRQIKFLLSNCTELPNIQSLEMLIDWLDGYLHHYRKHMHIRFFDREKLEFVTWKDYDEAILNIHKSLKNAEAYLHEEKTDRVKYVFWLNRWSELLASCFPKLQLVPPSRMDGPNRELIDEEETEDPEEPQDEPDSNDDDFEEPTGVSFPVQS